jgi:regulation of enolase protein 1 (concanavalin A-like superfamily)
MSVSYVREPFNGADLPACLRWYCEPQCWSVHPEERLLRVEPDARTDFWRKTHYGFEADNGHFLHTEVAGDFILTVQVRFCPVHQYDQAGVMVRASPSCWLKASVEYEPDGPSRLGAVVTNAAYSDWSTQRFPRGPGEVWLRVRREGGDYLLDASPDGQDWEQLRVAHLHDARPGSTVACGVYACSPRGAGFVAEFIHLSIDAGRLG